MKRALSLALPAIVAGLTGCGGKPTQVEDATTEVAPLPPQDDATRAKRIVEAYRAFSFTRCKGGEDCGALLAHDAGEAANAAWNPRIHMSSPDDTWIVEWLRLPTAETSARYAYAAMALAAVRRTWLEACEKSFVAYEKDLDARLGELEPKLARLKIETNPYDRIGGVLALEPEKPRKGEPGMGEFVKGSDAVRHAYEVALYDAFNDSGRTFVYAFDGYAPSEQLVATMKPRQPDDYAKIAFCMDAADKGLEGVEPLPDTSSWDGEVRAMVREVIPKPQRALVETKRSQLALQVRAKFANALTKDPQLPTGVREITVGAVTKFERYGRAATVTVTQTREEKKDVGGVRRTQKIDEVSTVDFKDWPSGIVLEPGDGFSFYGAETSVKDTVIKSTPELEHLSRVRSVEGRHVTRTNTKKDGEKKFFR